MRISILWSSIAEKNRSRSEGLSIRKNRRSSRVEASIEFMCADDSKASVLAEWCPNSLIVYHFTSSWQPLGSMLRISRREIQ